MAVSIVFGLAAGFIATVVMTVFMAPMMKKGPGVSQFIAARVGGGDPASKSAMMGGMVAHLIYGTAMGGIYALGTSALNLVVVSHLVNGLLFGIFLFIIAVAIVTPLSRAPMKQTPMSMMVVFLVLHLLYGLVLGASVAWLTGSPVL